ncbi:MAG: Asp-tRNA(Asn)/Glu-tRNA(Gln) amidotransferase subunit GatC [Patescibacteria group bacterium]
MKRDDIIHLAKLARIRLEENELVSLENELSSIVDYVGVVTEIAGEQGDEAPELGLRYNVFRKDKVTNQPDQYTKDILAEMPDTDGRYMKVKKILTIDE